MVSFGDIGTLGQPIDFLVGPKRSKGSYHNTWDSSFQGGVDQGSHFT